MKYWDVTFDHSEGDGVNTVMTGYATGRYVCRVMADTERDARQTFDACHRHGNTIASVEAVDANQRQVLRFESGK